MTTLITRSAAETHALGARLGRAAVEGTVVALIGDLGAGKTCFAQGVAEGLGVGEAVQSPTFVVVSTHESGRLPLHHADVYRVDDPADLEQTGLEELVGDGVVLVEWCDKHPWMLPADHLEVRLDHAGDRRRITLTATGPRHAALLEAVLG